AGALPAPVKFIEDRTISAALGKDSIRQGIYASLAGLVFVAIFMVVYYHVGGLIANVALLLNMIILMGAMAWFKFTLTLPGIAGIILTIGMAVDANVLIFERMREEQALGKKIRTVIENGYDRAFLAIFDSNLTTLLSGVILFVFGTGAVKGYAVTLSIGIATSMFTALVVTRNIFDYLSLSKHFHKLTMMKVIGVPKIDFIGKGVIAISLSLIIMVIGAVAFVHQGSKNFGIDFTGGSLIEMRFKQPVQIDAVRKALEEVNLGTSTIQQSGDSDVIIKTVANVEDQIKGQIEKKFAGNAFEVLKTEDVGPAIGRDLKRKAVIALILSLIGIMVYLWFRFDVSYGVGALLSLLHDVLIAMAFLALTGRELSLAVIAALLTIIGYSVNDTIVIFDRVRENLKYMRKTDLKNVFNVSLNQTLSRTILTSMTVLFVVLCLYLFGGQVINDFAFTLLIGTIAGSYSTVFIASPLVLWWRGNQKL
ncbi:MAG TPA: protein translocase subunit SecF, partial [bacterium]|nr:protein translocase subunit SecF [bacterium]